MARRRKSGKKADAAGTVILLAVVGFVVLVINYWPIALALAVIALLVWLGGKSSGSTPKPENLPKRIPAKETPWRSAPIGPQQGSAPMPAVRPNTASHKPTSPATAKRTIEIEIFVDRQNENTPPPRDSQDSARWIPPGASIQVAGFNLPGGMIYMGDALNAPNGSREPALINPSLPVLSDAVAPSEGKLPYWPSYHSISPGARRAYLTWLAGGRTDPSADIGYVFLYFYGLERRVLIDAASGGDAVGNFPQIAAELRRLLSIYTDHSFQMYASQLLGYVDAKTSDRAGLEPPQAQERYGGMSMQLRVGLGQLAVAGKPVPADWAASWAKGDPNIRLTTPASRCPEQFWALFKTLYTQKHGDGIKLPINKTKLKLTYQPASGGIMPRTFQLGFGDLPDLMAVTTPAKKLQEIVNEVSETLSPYSRLIGKQPEKAQFLEALLLLPPALWPADAKAALDFYNSRVGSGMTVIKLGDLTTALGKTQALSREVVKALLNALGTLQIGVEPDVLAGAKTPKVEDSIVLFRLDPSETAPVSSKNYDIAAIMLDLGANVAHADGAVAPTELQFLNSQINAWTHVGPAAQRRLRARLRLLAVEPPTLPSLRKRIEPLSGSTKSAIAKLVSAIALADGVITPAEVKLVEKIYKALGLDVQLAYSDLHGASGPSSAAATFNSAPVATTARQGEEAGFNLDASRVAALQGETQLVSELLAKVFVDEPQAAPVATATATETDLEITPADAGTLLGLDADHSAFLRLLLSRESWSRQELSDAASDMELMLDGALERINEAALDQYDIPLTDGDDPIEVAQEVKEQIAA